MQFTRTVASSAPPEEIWRIWTDVERWPEWDIELEEAFIDGDFTAGAQGRVRPKKGPETEFSVSRLEDGQSYTIITPLVGSRLVITRRLEPIGMGTRFTHDVRFEGPTAPIFAAIYKKRFEKALPCAMEIICQLAERAPLADERKLAHCS